MPMAGNERRAEDRMRRLYKAARQTEFRNIPAACRKLEKNKEKRIPQSIQLRTESFFIHCRFSHCDFLKTGK